MARKKQFVHSPDLEDLDLEDECRFGGDHALDAVRAICVVVRNGQHRLLAQRHGHHALIPATDHLADTDRELERAPF
eukprot:CAMPEP_0172587546 /NCGR_PEP_ID=MMETSP1068-20121228/6575_1 /TAXON_ID=35684 /ORGANISM="Pseudopedinella elastica, Strain CCMP716" /LENGTH=76 /DNA_ID=CAMNT_0013382603 /DNA_START=342 /DNA_END=573 /DNA_ORIENTATION=-